MGWDRELSGGLRRVRSLGVAAAMGAEAAESGLAAKNRALTPVRSQAPRSSGDGKEAGMS